MSTHYDANIVAAVRTAGAKKNGRLREWHPISLGATVLDALVERSGIDPNHIDDVVVGCVSQVGGQSGNIGRYMVLASKSIPEHVPGTAVDRQCGASAGHSLCRSGRHVGVQDVVIAAGVEHRPPSHRRLHTRRRPSAKSALPEEVSDKHGARLAARGQRAFSQFEGAELVSETYNISRLDMEKLAVASHERAVRATKEGRFDREIVPLKGLDKEGNEAFMTRTRESALRHSLASRSSRRSRPAPRRESTRAWSRRDSLRKFVTGLRLCSSATQKVSKSSGCSHGHDLSGCRSRLQIQS